MICIEGLIILNHNVLSLLQFYEWKLERVELSVRLLSPR
jgi:hypothetical protein